jgi:hypothetical protein
VGASRYCGTPALLYELVVKEETVLTGFLPSAALDPDTTCLSPVLRTAHEGTVWPLKGGVRSPRVFPLMKG